jgi:hypothetical protein
MLHINLYEIVTIGIKLYKTEVKVSIVQISYMGYFKFYYSLLGLKKVVTFAYFNVTIYIEFVLFNY